MQENNTESLARSVKYLHTIPRLLIYHFTIYKPFNAFFYLYSFISAILVTMKHIMHITTRECFDWLTNEIRNLPHGSLHVCFHEVYTKSITELDGYHVASSSRSQFKKMNIVFLIKNYLHIKFTKTYSQNRDNSLQLLVYLLPLEIRHQQRFFFPNRNQRTLACISKTLHLTI